MYSIAFELKKTIGEIGDMTVEEFSYWREFFDIRQKELEEVYKNNGKRNKQNKIIKRR